MAMTNESAFWPSWIGKARPHSVDCSPRSLVPRPHGGREHAAPIPGMSVVEVGRALRTGNPRETARSSRSGTKAWRSAPSGPRRGAPALHHAARGGHLWTHPQRQGVRTTDQGLPLEHPIHSVGDYKVLEYIAEHTFYEPCYDEYLKYEAAVGDEGYPMVSCGMSVPLFPPAPGRIQSSLLRDGGPRRGVRAPHHLDGAGRAGAPVARRGRFAGPAHPPRRPLRLADDPPHMFRKYMTRTTRTSAPCCTRGASRSPGMRTTTAKTSWPRSRRLASTCPSASARPPWSR